jgi:hypothetical protein
MSNPSSCCNTCETPETVAVPGTSGQGAFTETTALFVVPALGDQVQLAVTNSEWVTIGSTVFIEGAGTFEVVSTPTATSMLLEYLNVASNTASGNNISSGAGVVAGAEPGADGTDGINSFSVLTAGFTVPAQGANVSIPDGFVHVASSEPFGVGQIVFISDGTDFGSFRVISKPDTISFVAEYLGYAGEAAPGAAIGINGTVSPGGTQPALAAALPTALTDNSTGTASNTIAAGVGVQTITIPLSSLATGLSTLAIDLLTNYIVGYAFKILKFDFVTTIVGAGAGASQVFNLEIGTTNLTGGVLTVTLASTDTIGEVTTGTAITANNVGTASDTLSIEMAAGGTIFTSGSGYFVITVQNMDSASAFASLSDHINDLITSLT